MSEGMGVPMADVSEVRKGRGANRAVQESGLLIALIAAVIIFSLTAPNFTLPVNIFNILRSASFVGIIAMGMTFVIVSAEIDVSVGSSAALSSSILGVLVTELGWPVPSAVVTVIIVGGLVGVGAGLLRAKLNIPSFIATLALYLGLRGLGEFITKQQVLPVSGPLLDFFNGSILEIPVPALIFLVLFAAAWFVSRHTVFGRSIYAIGGNPFASRLAGINVDRVRVILFAITGGLAALVGVLLSARIGTATSVLATGMEFDVIAAVVIGGTSMAGGSGTPVGTVLGVLFVTVLSNALVLYGVNSSLQMVVRGVIVVLAVLLTNFQTGLVRKKT